MQQPIFYTYILTNWDKTVLYTGITNNLAERLVEHWIGQEGSFTTLYKVHYLVWFETTRYVLNAIDREKKIKRCTRQQKEALITDANPKWDFHNESILGNWPPTSAQMNAVREHWRRDKKENAATIVGITATASKDPLRG